MPLQNKGLTTSELCNVRNAHFSKFVVINTVNGSFVNQARDLALLDNNMLLG